MLIGFVLVKEEEANNEGKEIYKVRTSNKGNQSNIDYVPFFAHFNFQNTPKAR